MKPLCFLLLLLLSFNNSFCQEPLWQWVQPTLPSNTLYTAVYAAQNTIVAAGGCVTILKSTDNGVTWKIVRAGGFSHIRSITFTDAMTGFTAGSEGEIMKTTDGGETWTVKNTGTTYLKGISFADATTGYACGDHIILKTTDSGESWNVIHDSIFDLNSVYFLPGTETGFVAGKAGVILKTIDGGASWSRLESGTMKDLNGVVFVNASRGYAVGNSGLLLITTNGGDAWTPIGLGEGYSLTSIAFSDESNGYLTTSGGDMFYTPDGFNWFKRYLNVWAPLYAAAVQGERCIITGAYGTILMSDNKYAQLTRITDRENYGSYSSVAFLTPDHGYAVGNCIGETNDRGNTWNNKYINQYNPFHGVDIFFVDSQRSFITTGGDSYMKTMDGWKTWLTYSLANPAGGTNQVYFKNADTGFITDLSLHISTDRGITWQVAIQADPGGFGGMDPPEYVNDVTFVTPQTGIAAGTYIWKSTDGGITWYKTNLPDGGWHCFLSVFFADSLTGSVCGNAGEIFKTTDGGDSWSEQESGVTGELNSICFHQGTGYAAGNDGVLLVTNDFGENWNQQPPMTTNDLKCVYFTEEHVCFLLGDYTLLRTGPYSTGFVDPEGSEAGLKIYPNPAQDYIVVNASRILGMKEIRIYDCTGHMVLSETSNDPNPKISVKNLIPGLYIVGIVGDGEMLLGKFIRM